jgi:translation initiation factor 3 subunit K
MAEGMKERVSALLKGIDRYNPENLEILERYVYAQAAENTYDLEANLAVLKLYQFNPTYFQLQVVSMILLKALTNLPHTDYTMCKCLVDVVHFEDEPLKRIDVMADILEMCQFQMFWKQDVGDLTMGITDFDDSVRKFICHVVGITYQQIRKSELRELLGNISEANANHWIARNGWKDQGDGYVYIANQEDNIKTKNIKEKITFDGVASIMATVAPPAPVPHSVPVPR